MQITNSKSGKIDSVTGERISSSKYALHVVSEGAGVAWDNITASYPTSASEVYTYTLNSDVVRTVTVTYSDATKEELVSIVRT